MHCIVIVYWLKWCFSKSDSWWWFLNKKIEKRIQLVFENSISRRLKLNIYCSWLFLAWTCDITPPPKRNLHNKNRLTDKDIVQNEYRVNKFSWRLEHKIHTKQFIKEDVMAHDESVVGDTQIKNENFFVKETIRVKVTFLAEENLFF